MGYRGAIIHVNKALLHQVRYAEYFAEGFRAGGMPCEISPRPDTEADLHVCIGPHFALGRWRDHPACIHVDRAFWRDPECVAVGWSAPNGSRRFPVGLDAREKPSLEPYRSGRDAIVLADYGDTGESLASLLRPHMESVTIRRHPADGGEGALLDAMQGKSIAVGCMTTALIDAAINGLAVICRDQRNPVSPVASFSYRDLTKPDRSKWLHALSWANWHHTEISNGDLWQALTTRCG